MPASHEPNMETDGTFDAPHLMKYRNAAEVIDEHCGVAIVQGNNGAWYHGDVSVAPPPDAGRDPGRVVR